jgi:hypothetical protein
MSNKIDLEKLKTTMLSIIETANEVIVEAGSENPNVVTICDLAIERMDELFQDVEVAVLGLSAVVNNFNRSVFGEEVVMKTDTP